MRETRLHKRIPCSGQGFLDFETEQLAIAALNLSKGGALLRMEETVWERFQMEERHNISGQLTVDGDAFQFKARIAWSSKEGSHVLYGVEFKEHDDHLIKSVLERLSLEEEGPRDFFNIG